MCREGGRMRLAGRVRLSQVWCLAGQASGAGRALGGKKACGPRQVKTGEAELCTGRSRGYGGRQDREARHGR